MKNIERMGIGGRVASFLKAVYMNVSGEVNVGEVCSTVSLSGWHVAYDKVAHHCCSLGTFSHWSEN